MAFRDECVRVMSGPDEFTPRRFFVEKLLATMEYGNIPCCFYRLSSGNMASPSGQPV